MSGSTVNLYDNVYGDFASSAEAAVRQAGARRVARLSERVRFEVVDASRPLPFALEVRDVTANAAEIASRWHDARARHRGALVAREGEANFDGLQRFLQRVHTLSVEWRLSRYAYLAEKRAPA